MRDQLINDIATCREEFETTVENGNWCEKWDSGQAWDFLADYLLAHGWTNTNYSLPL
jgi:hypothetical protein